MPTNLRPPIGLKTLRRLARRRSARTEAGCFVIEGTLSVRAALDAGHELVEAFAEPRADQSLVFDLDAAGVPVVAVAAGRLDGIVSTTSPQPVAAVAVTPSRSLADLSPAAARALLVLVDVGDPGNVGTLLRVAEASGVAAVLCLGETADPFGPKSVRASAGSLFSVGVVVDKEAIEVVSQLAASGWSVIATSSHADLAYDEIDLTGPVAFVLGSEAHGVRADVATAASRAVRIPMVGAAESLNVAMAGSVLCFESLRQIRTGAQPDG